MSRNLSFKSVPEGHYILIPVVLEFSSSIQDIFGTPFWNCLQGPRFEYPIQKDNPYSSCEMRFDCLKDPKEAGLLTKV